MCCWLRALLPRGAASASPGAWATWGAFPNHPAPTPQHALRPVAAPLSSSSALVARVSARFAGLPPNPGHHRLQHQLGATEATRAQRLGMGLPHGHVFYQGRLRATSGRSETCQHVSAGSAPGLHSGLPAELPRPLCSNYVQTMYKPCANYVQTHVQTHLECNAYDSFLEVRVGHPLEYKKGYN